MGDIFVTVRLDNIAVIDMDDRLIGAPFFHLSQISFQGIFRSSFSEMAGKTVNDIFGVFFESCVKSVSLIGDSVDRTAETQASSQFSPVLFSLILS